MTGDEGRLGPYQLRHLLGEGGMGVVHLASTPDGRIVALKVLRPGVVAGARGRERLAREVEALRRVRGARVAEVFDADVLADPPYVVTRFVPGRSLDRLVDEHGPLRGPALHRLAAGLAAALADVHEAGLVHRDVKPGNVMIDGASVVLIDFGLARAVDETRLTTTGLLVGTPGYLAPETAAGQPPSTATDVHGWGATVAFAGTGSGPYGEGPVVAVLDRIRRGEIRVDGLDPTLGPIVRAALATESALRPTLAEVRSVLRAIVAPAGWSGEPVTALLRPSPTRVDLPAATPVPPAPTPAASRPTPALPFPAAMPAPRSAEDPPPAVAWPGDGVLPRWPLELAAPPPASGAAALTLLALGGLVVAGALAAPYLTLLLLAAALLVARTTDRLRRRLLRRRLAHGRRPSDASVVIAEAPVRAVLAAPLTALQALFVAGVAGVAALLLWGLAVGPEAPYVAAGVAAAATAWWGPGGGSVRRGARTVVAPLSRSGLAGWVVAGALVGLAWVVVLVAEEFAVVWWPASGPPLLWP